MAEVYDIRAPAGMRVIGGNNMRSSLHGHVMGAIALLLVSLPAWAVSTGVQVAGVSPGDIASGTISFGNQPAQPLVSRSDCEQQKKDGESCDAAYLWFAVTNSTPAIGTAVTVRLTDRNGNTTSGTGTVTSDGIRVSVPAFSKSGSPRTASADGTGFRVNLGYDEHTLPAGNGGLGIRYTVGSPGSERFVLVSPERFEGETAGILIGTPWRLRLANLQIRLGLLALFGAWDADDSELLPTGTEGRGWAYQVESAPSGSTGIGFPAATTELEVGVDHDIEKWGFGINGMTVPSDNGVSFGVGFQYSETTQDIDTTTSTPQYTGANLIAAEMSEEVRDRNFMVPVTIRRTWNPNSTVSPFIQGVLAPGYFDSDLSGTFLSTCNLCPPSDQTVTQDIDDSDSGFTWEAGLGLGVDFHVGDRFVIGLFANYGYHDRLSYADNRESPLDDPPHLGDDDADFWAAGVSFAVELRD